MIKEYDTGKLTWPEIVREIESDDRAAQQQLGDYEKVTTWRGLVMRVEWHKKLQAKLQSDTQKIQSAQVIAKAIVEGEQAKKAMADAVLIKGLAEAMTAARKSITAARAAPIALQQSATALQKTCADLQAQVDKMNDDIKFEATQLGNGGEVSGQS